MKKTCVSCAGEFTVNSNSQKYCEPCRKRKCLYCKIEFITEVRFDCKFCSRDCYLKNRFGTGVCKFCNKKSNNRFCTSDCRKSFWNKNEYNLFKKKRLWERKLEIVSKLGGVCVKCGNSDIRCLDINHIDRSKKNIPKKRNYTWQFRLKEWSENMNNIELLCANCHRIHTWKQIGYGLY